MYKQRKNILDIYKIGDRKVGIFREPFERVMELDGFELTPAGKVNEVWNFTNSTSGLRGRLINVDGYLGDASMALTTRGRVYMVTRQDFTLGLLFPGLPRRIKLSEARYKVLPDKDQISAYPGRWSALMVERVIRQRFQNIIILEEGFLLEQIGLRGKMEVSSV